LGHQQANHVADTVSAEQGISAVYASTFPRAIQTAQPLCERLQCEAMIDTRLEEFQLPIQASIDAQPDVIIWQASHRVMPEGETLEEFSQRIAQFMNQGNFIWLASWRQPALDIFDIFPESRASTVLDTAIDLIVIRQTLSPARAQLRL